MRRATNINSSVNTADQISIHALLAESDSFNPLKTLVILPFLSTLSLRRATKQDRPTNLQQTISIHALLAESDSRKAAMGKPTLISIHALLAESDLAVPHLGKRDIRFLSTLSLRRATPHINMMGAPVDNFYPRSPCGERREYWVGGYGTANNFYPRSPCGERPPAVIKNSTAFSVFLSTLSLRRATSALLAIHVKSRISIHALLAESDGNRFAVVDILPISIHALLAESDPQIKMMGAPVDNFYPRSPCGERPDPSAG